MMVPLHWGALGGGGGSSGEKVPKQEGREGHGGFGNLRKVSVAGKARRTTHWLILVARKLWLYLSGYNCHWWFSSVNLFDFLHFKFISQSNNDSHCFQNEKSDPCLCLFVPRSMASLHISRAQKAMCIISELLIHVFTLHVKDFGGRGGSAEECQRNNWIFF